MVEEVAGAGPAGQEGCRSAALAPCLRPSCPSPDPLSPTSLGPPSTPNVPAGPEAVAPTRALAGRRRRALPAHRAQHEGGRLQSRAEQGGGAAPDAPSDSAPNACTAPSSLSLTSGRVLQPLRDQEQADGARGGRVPGWVCEGWGLGVGGGLRLPPRTWGGWGGRSQGLLAPAWWPPFPRRAALDETP